MRRILQWLLPLVLYVSCPPDALAGRRSVRIDIGAWNFVSWIYFNGTYQECPPAVTFYAEVFPWGGPGSPPLYGLLRRSDLGNESTLGVGATDFFTGWFPTGNLYECQSSKPYTPGASPDEYFNGSQFDATEPWLAWMVGDNKDNHVQAMRYSFLDNSIPAGRQWAFYFFDTGLTVVALYGVPDGQPTNAYITASTYDTIWSLWNGQTSPDWSGEYFCFQYGVYEGYCSEYIPPPPEEMFTSGFEGGLFN